MGWSLLAHPTALALSTSSHQCGRDTRCPPSRTRQAPAEASSGLRVRAVKASPLLHELQVLEGHDVANGCIRTPRQKPATRATRLIRCSTLFLTRAHSTDTLCTKPLQVLRSELGDHENGNTQKRAKSGTAHSITSARSPPSTHPPSGCPPIFGHGQEPLQS